MAEVCGKLFSSWPFGECYLKSITRENAFFYLSLDSCEQTLDLTLITRVPFITLQIIFAPSLSPCPPIPSYLNPLLSLDVRLGEYTISRPTSLHFGFSLRPTASVLCTLAWIPKQLREQSSAVNDQKEHLMSDQCLMEASLILQDASCYERNKVERGDRNANRKGRGYGRMQQILLSAHHEPSWTPSVLICSHWTGLNLDPRTCPPATHSTSECCYGTRFFFINLLAKLRCAPNGVALLLSLKQLLLSV